jgi:S-adenosylmethionine hydrolase
MAVITLLSDFGLYDEYVGVMKGVILSISPLARIIDLTHQVEPQDLVSAAYRIQTAYRYFPQGTVHVAVVDPGVGSRRAIIAVALKGHFFVAPDNGLLTLVVDKETPDRVVRVENPSFFLNDVSATFHGRDILAPVAAHLTLGVKLDRLGPAIDPAVMQRLKIGPPSFESDGTLAGTVILIDRFGNLVTNIDAGLLEAVGDKRCGDGITVRLGKHRIKGLAPSYSSVAHDAPLAILGSRGYLEIAVNCGRADEYFKACKGDRVYVDR